MGFFSGLCPRGRRDSGRIRATAAVSKMAEGGLKNQKKFPHRARSSVGQSACFTRGVTGSKISF